MVPGDGPDMYLAWRRVDKSVDNNSGGRVYIGRPGIDIGRRNVTGAVAAEGDAAYHESRA